jgi:hypothetical protein
LQERLKDAPVTVVRYVPSLKDKLRDIIEKEGRHEGSEFSPLRIKTA